MKLFFFALILTFTSTHSQENKKFKLARITNEATFESPVQLVTIHAYKDIFFIVEQSGSIKYFKRGESNKIETFLDIKSKVDHGGEKGLLGLAFHPKFQDNGYFFINYTATVNANLKTFVSRMKANLKTLKADKESEEIFLTIDQPAPNHNGGSIIFGKDGLLYISTGDGGFAGDPKNNAQDKDSLLGKILTVDVDQGPKTQPKVYAYGLRNPWKISFDEVTGELWAADVGQNKWEEINIIKEGQNYGWRIKEGKHCFKPEKNCPQKGLTDPVFEYQNANNNCSITGGYAYRGTRLEQLKGFYIYGDYCSGNIWAYNPKSRKSIHLLRSDLNISSFGQDEDGEIYVLDHSSGHVFQLGRFAITSL